MATRHSILISGAGGFLGTALAAHLASTGNTVGRLVRRPSDDPETVEWDPLGGVKQPERLAKYDTIVHLAGRNLAGSRWTPGVKREIRVSRIEGTRAIVEGMRRAKSPPATLVCASAVGYYGDRGSDALDEGSAAGTGFLAEVCRDWEASARALESTGARVVCARFGVILGRSGGALAKMLPAFRRGLGGPLGSGDQFFSWIALHDAVAAVSFVIADDRFRGPVNVVSPQPVPNERFTQALGAAIGRPTFLRAPAFALKLILGEMADDALLASQRALPKQLTDAGFSFRFPEIETFLRHEFAT